MLNPGELPLHRFALSAKGLGRPARRAGMARLWRTLRGCIGGVAQSRSLLAPHPSPAPAIRWLEAGGLRGNVAPPRSLPSLWAGEGRRPCGLPVGKSWRARRGARPAVKLSLQAASYFGDAGIGADLVFLATGSTGDADGTDHFVADLDWDTATNGDDVGDLSQIGVLRLIGQVFEFEGRLAARAGCVRLEPPELHGVWVGAIAAQGRGDIAGLIDDNHGYAIAILRTLLERTLDDHQRHLHGDVFLDLRRLGIAGCGAGARQQGGGEQLAGKRHGFLLW